MKPVLLKVPCGPSHSFSLRQDVNPYFYNQWHYHEELELTYIRQGSGTRFVGDHIENFQAGDLVLLGSNLPHFWRSEDPYFREGNTALCESTVVHFAPGLLSPTFSHLPEFADIQALFSRAQRGLRITGQSQQQVGALMEDLFRVEGLERLLLLIRILQAIATCPQVRYLSSLGFSYSLNESDTQRLAKIYNHTLAHFSRKILLEEVAALVHLTPNAFCRYFKSHTRKTYTQFLLEIRVGHACKLLIEDKMSIGQVCLESGFQDSSNFNRYFKAITRQSPRAFLKLHQQAQPGQL
jgi:AraC-like DNA-binding protein